MQPWEAIVFVLFWIVWIFKARIGRWLEIAHYRYKQRKQQSR